MTDINFRVRPRLLFDVVSWGWASNEAHIRYLVDVEYPNTVKNLGTIISTLENELGRLEQKRIAINDSVLDAAEANLLALLEAKRVANGWYGPVDTYGDFGNSNISDWRIFDLGTGSVAGTGVTINSFTVTGSVAGQYPNGAPVVIDGSIIRLVQSATNPPIPPAPQVTTVVLQAGTPISIGPILVTPPQIVYTYLGVGWDSDAAITFEINAFAVGYDHITHPLGLTGTYGLNERIAQLEKGRDLQVDNKAAYENFINYYDPYGS